MSDVSDQRKYYERMMDEIAIELVVKEVERRMHEPGIDQME